MAPSQMASSGAGELWREICGGRGEVCVVDGWVVGELGSCCGSLDMVVGVGDGWDVCWLAFVYYFMSESYKSVWCRIGHGKMPFFNHFDMFELRAFRAPHNPTGGEHQSFNHDKSIR